MTTPKPSVSVILRTSVETSRRAEASVISLFVIPVISLFVVPVVTPSEATIAVTVKSVAIISLVEAVSHTIIVLYHHVRSAIVSAIPAASAVGSPAMSTAIYGIEVRLSVVEIVPVWVSCIDSEPPITRIPIKRTVEICGFAVCLILPIVQYIA